jgi:hypothetical protein
MNLTLPAAVTISVFVCDPMEVPKNSNRSNSCILLVAADARPVFPFAHWEGRALVLPQYPPGGSVTLHEKQVPALPGARHRSSGRDAGCGSTQDVGRRIFLTDADGLLGRPDFEGALQGCCPSFNLHGLLGRPDFEGALQGCCPSFNLPGISAW